MARNGNALTAVVGGDYSSRSSEREVEQVVIEHGTVPLQELYFELKDGSRNRGEIDYEALLSLQAQAVTRNADGHYRLYRVGDAVSSRNIHAAIYDSLRLCLAL